MVRVALRPGNVTVLGENGEVKTLKGLVRLQSRYSGGMGKGTGRSGSCGQRRMGAPMIRRGGQSGEVVRSRLGMKVSGHDKVRWSLEVRRPES